MITKVDLRNLTWVNVRGGSAGMLPKDTFIQNGMTYFVKMSSYNMQDKVYGLESISEVLASRLGFLLGFNCAHYELYNALVKKDGAEFSTYLTISENYNPNNFDRLAFEDFYVSFAERNERPFDFALRWGWGQEIFEMFVFDYLINNFDRHGANLEVFTNEHGNYVLSPLFDNGNSLYRTHEEHRIKDVYYGEDSSANNFIGGHSLLNNLGLVQSPVSLKPLTDETRIKLFENLEEVVSKDREETIWNHILRRYAVCRQKKIIT